MTQVRKYILLILLLISVLILAGCSGGGGAASVDDDVPAQDAFSDDLSSIEADVPCELFLSSNIKALIPLPGSVFIPNTGNDLIWAEYSGDSNIIIVEITNKASASISRKFAMIGGTVTDQPQLGGWQINFPPGSDIDIAPTGALTITMSSGDCDLND